MDKVVITGGLGFIFSHVTEYLIEKGYEVHIIDNLSAGSHPEILKNEASFLNADAESPEALDYILLINPDYIIHAAAYSDVDKSITTPGDIIEANTKATLNVFEAARQCSNLKKLVYISTDEVYGECAYPKKEDEIIFPKNPYSFSKAYGSLLRLTYDNTYPSLKDKTAETRFCNVFGPRQDDRKILSRIKEGFSSPNPIPIHNGGKGYREYIYVKNIPPIVEEIMLKGNRTYNITTGDGFTVNELVEIAGILNGVKLNVAEGLRPGMDLQYRMNADRVTEEFNWKPEWSFEEGIREYLHA